MHALKPTRHALPDLTPAVTPAPNLAPPLVPASWCMATSPARLWLPLQVGTNTPSYSLMTSLATNGYTSCARSRRHQTTHVRSSAASTRYLPSVSVLTRLSPSQLSIPTMPASSFLENTRTYSTQRAWHSRRAPHTYTSSTAWRSAPSGQSSRWCGPTWSRVTSSQECGPTWCVTRLTC